MRIPELDTILPYKCRARKRHKVNRDMEFLKGVPEQYHQVILAKMADERAAHASTPRASSRSGATASTCIKSEGAAAPTCIKSEGAAVAPTVIKSEGAYAAPTVIKKDSDGDDDDAADDDDGDDDEEDTAKDDSDGEDKDDIFKDDTNIKTEPAADPPAGSPAPVYINAHGHISKADLGPRAVLGQWRVDDDTVVSPKRPEDVVTMEARFAAAHDAHSRAEKMKRPAAAAKRPACAHSAPLAAAVNDLRLRKMRRLRGKQSAPIAYHTFTIPDAVVMEKVNTLKNMASFQSWGYHRVRAAIKKCGYSDAYAKHQASMWHRNLKDIWTDTHGDAR